MSNVWRHDRAASANAIGSFAFERLNTSFTPWAWQQDEPLVEEVEEDFLIITEEDEGEDPVALQSDAFAQGFEAGRRTVELELADERNAVARLAEALQVLRPEPTNALAALLAETVERLVRQIVGESEIEPGLFRERAQAAAAMIGEELEPARLRLHPDDVPHMEGARIPIPVTADPTLSRGTILLETGEGWIEDGPAVRLEKLRASLDEMGARL